MTLKMDRVVASNMKKFPAMLKSFAGIRNSIHRAECQVGNPSSISKTNVFPRPSQLLPSERAALCESGLATGGLAEDGRTTSTDDDCLSMRENGGDGEAAWALDIHEE